ncbi:MAG: magnesium transporter [Bacteroidetes bacterium]|nr:magnesium transporter [Bacteroidota bacterium]
MEKTVIDKSLRKQFSKWIEENNQTLAIDSLATMYPQDIAELANELNDEQTRALLTLLEADKLVKVLVELEEPVRETFFSSFSAFDIANVFIERMDSDDAVYVLSQLPQSTRDEVIGKLTDIEYASQLLSLLSYKENTGGSLMAVELVKIKQNATVASCIEEIRLQAENVDSIYVVYVTDEFERLTGIITLKNLILANPAARIEDVYNKEVISVSTSASVEDISNLARKYDLVVVPVVDPLGRLVGRITIDDIVDVIREEADENYQLMSGITEDVDATDKVWILSRARLPWLLIGLLGGIASSRFIELYEDQIRIHPEMAFFMPLIAAMGGNAGVQSSAIVVQGLANDTLGTKDILQKILKESRVALLNGLICSLLILGYNLLISPGYDLALTVSIALLTVIIFASLFGTFVPLLLNKLKVDPAIATGPFITTTNDLLGIAIYFSLGHFMYDLA